MDEEGGVGWGGVGGRGGEGAHIAIKRAEGFMLAKGCSYWFPCTCSVSRNAAT